MLSESKKKYEILVNLISKFCANWCCIKTCMKKRRRNPVNPKEFIRICVDCEDMFIRKILFENFWNEYTRKIKEVQLKKKRKHCLKEKSKKKLKIWKVKEEKTQS